jgi:hypothetical protein
VAFAEARIGVPGGVGLLCSDGDAAHGGGPKQLVEVEDAVVAGLGLHDDRGFEQGRGRDERVFGVGQQRDESVPLRFVEQDGEDGPRCREPRLQRGRPSGP